MKNIFVFLIGIVCPAHLYGMEKLPPDILRYIISFLPKKEFEIEGEGTISVPEVKNLIHVNKQWRTVCHGDPFLESISKNIVTQCIALDTITALEKLESQRIFPNQHSLHLACILGSKRVVEKYLTTLDPNTTIPIHVTDARGTQTPLTVAIKQGHAHVVRLLLSHPKTNPNKPAVHHTDHEHMYYCFPLVMALSNDNPHISQGKKLEIIKLLLEHPRLNPFTADRHGNFSQEIARQRGYTNAFSRIVSIKRKLLLPYIFVLE